MVHAGTLRTQHRAPPPRMHPQPYRHQHKLGSLWCRLSALGQHRVPAPECTHSPPDPNTSREVYGASREPQDATYSTSKTPQRSIDTYTPLYILRRCSYNLSLQTNISRTNVCCETPSQRRQSYQGAQAKRRSKRWTSMQFCVAGADGRSPLDT